MKNFGVAKLVVVALAAVAGTATFMIACGGGPSHASAALTCSQWQVAELSLSTICPSGSQGVEKACDLPAGWEPINEDGPGFVLVGRCKP